MFETMKAKLLRNRHEDELNSKIQRMIEEVTIEALCALRDELILQEKYSDDDLDKLTCVVLGVQDAKRRLHKLDN